MSPVSIPLDIIEEIISKMSIYGDGKGALQACALTCKLFQEPAQRRIFESVELPNHLKLRKRTLHRFQLLQNLFKVNPGLRCYVRNLQILDDIQDIRLVSDPFLSSLVQLCQNLRRFQLQFIDDVNRRKFDWDSFLPCFKQSVTDLFASNSILAVSLSEIQNVPARVLLGIPHLGIDGVHFNDKEEPRVVPPTNKERGKMYLYINQQELSMTKTFIDYLKTYPLDMLKLGSMDELNIAVAQAIIEVSPKSLRSLQLRDVISEGNWLQNLNISCLQNLNTLDMSTTSFSELDILAFKSILSKVGANNSLQNIIFPVYDFRSSDVGWTQSNWKYVDGTILKEPFTQIREVHFKDDLGYYFPDNVRSDVELLLRMNLPKLLENGLLYLEGVQLTKK